MERNIARLAELAKQLGEAELSNQQWMLRSDERLLRSERRTQELAEQMRRIRESNTENIRRSWASSRRYRPTSPA